MTRSRATRSRHIWLHATAVAECWTTTATRARYARGGNCGRSRAQSHSIATPDAILPNCCLPEQSAPLSGRVDGFEILGVLGRGGSGIVYKALQVKLNRLVALKMLSAGPHASRRAIERLRAESATIAAFEHPQVVTMFDVGEFEGVPYLCLELIEGGSLAERLEANPRSVPEAVRLTCALAAWCNAHERGIIHRDLKPANVLLAGPRDCPLDPQRLKLTDFGLAKRLDAEGSAAASISGMIMGTPSYMAPEQAMSGRAGGGPAVDVYGLGAILYELLTGRPPFQGDSPIETVLQVLQRPPVPPSQVNEQIPETLEAICLKCLEKDPRRRYGSASELGNALERFASESTRIGSTRRSSAGHRYRAAAAVAGGLLAICMLIPFGRLAFRTPKRTPSLGSVRQVRLVVTSPDIPCLPEGEHSLRGKIEMSPSVEDLGAGEKIVRFDLRDDEHYRLLERGLTRNARIWEEHRHGVEYWGPIDDKQWFEVVYSFEFGFPIRAACLFASLNTADTEACGALEVSTNHRDWELIVQGQCLYPGAAQNDISKIVCGARRVYVRARMKGRDDGHGSSTAQFLRTSSLPEGHLELKTPHVFLLRAFDHEVPIVTGRIALSDSWSQPLWISEDGSFEFTRTFREPGKYQGTITVNAGAVASKSQEVRRVDQQYGVASQREPPCHRTSQR